MGSEIIHRDEADEIKKIKGWVLIYGRRKVGKTFLIKNFLDYDVFFRINRDGSIYAEKFFVTSIGSADDFSKAVIELLSSNKTVVIDEFQRLPESILERISMVHPQGKLIFSGSSMRVVKKLFGSSSPLLGLAMQYRLGLIKPDNMLRELSKKMDASGAVELAPYLADAWTIPFFKMENETTRTIYELLKYSKFTIPALVGEIFIEEEREYSRVYEAVLRLMGAGEWNYKNIASILAGRKLIERADSSLVLPYIKNMAAMGLVESLSLYSTKKKMYRLASPVMEAFFYLDDKYGFGETDVSFQEVKPTIEKQRSLAIQKFIGDLFAQAYNGKKEYFVTPSNELDFIITVRNKPVVAGEVKSGKYDEKDIKKFIEKSNFIDAEKVFVTKKKKETEINGVKIMDVSDLVAMTG
ncbi:MAG: AAA family ATPase [Candidatus Methanoperedenaceae archaeon]|nr:AAA family ATPase [Candidatus Methanoperedenaceae archaeon]